MSKPIATLKTRATDQVANLTPLIAALESADKALADAHAEKERLVQTLNPIFANGQCSSPEVNQQLTVIAAAFASQEAAVAALEAGLVDAPALARSIFEPLMTAAFEKARVRALPFVGNDPVRARNRALESDGVSNRREFLRVICDTSGLHPLSRARMAVVAFNDWLQEDADKQPAATVNAS